MSPEGQTHPWLETAHLRKLSPPGPGAQRKRSELLKLKRGRGGTLNPSDLCWCCFLRGARWSWSWGCWRNCKLDLIPARRRQQLWRSFVRRRLSGTEGPWEKGVTPPPAALRPLSSAPCRQSLAASQLAKPRGGWPSRGPRTTKLMEKAVWSRKSWPKCQDCYQISPVLSRALKLCMLTDITGILRWKWKSKQE